jgi:hypothetical protein
MATQQVTERTPHNCCRQATVQLADGLYYAEAVIAVAVR